MHAPHVYIPPRVDPDVLARHLGRMAALGRSMPPSWDGAGITHLMGSPDGDYLGKILPGRGVYLDVDAAALGLRALPPHVFTRSPIKKLISAFADPDAGDVRAEQAAIRVFETLRPVGGAAISTYDGIISARANGKANDVVVGKTGQSTSSEEWESLFLGAGNPSAGSYADIPGGDALDRSNAGAWSLGLSNPSGGDKKYLLTFGFTSENVIDMLALVDLLVAAGGILATTATTQTVDTATLTRYTTGAGVMMTFEVLTQLSNTAHNVTVAYTDQDGNAGASTGALASVANAAAGRLVPRTLGPFVQLASGDYGVRQIEDFTMGTALAAGEFAAYLYFPLMFVPGLAGGAYVERDSTTNIDGLTELVTTAGGALGCLCAFVLAGTTSTGVVSAFIRSCAG